MGSLLWVRTVSSSHKMTDFFILQDNYLIQVYEQTRGQNVMHLIISKD